MKNVDCPCGRNKSYQDCCGLIHKSLKEAETAEDLMRSRYTAFVKGNGQYLQKSHAHLSCAFQQRQHFS